MYSSYSLFLFKILFLFICVSSILVNTSLNNIFPYTIILSIRLLLIVLVILLIPVNFRERNNMIIWPVKIFLFWNIVCVIRGMFVADNYWEWKNLTNAGLMMLIPLTVYIFTNKFFVQQILSFWLKYGLLLFFILLPFALNSGYYGMYLNPVLFFLLIFPLLSSRWKIIVLFCFALVLLAGLDSRSSIIKFSLATLLGLLYYIRFILRIWMFKFLHFVFIVLPIVLLILGMMNIFNIFKMQEYIKGNYSVASTGSIGKTESLLADSRTMIYVENIDSALKHNYIIAGRTPANGYDSKHFGNFLKYLLHTGKLQRFSSEVAILNVFTWTGLVGVFLYFFVFFRASYLAVYKSNNYFMKIIGLFVAFRWSYAFVEDFTAFEIQYIILWMFISMCYSLEFREMSDLDFQNWAQSIFIKEKKIYN